MGSKNEIFLDMMRGWATHTPRGGGLNRLFPDSPKFPQKPILGEEYLVFLPPGFHQTP